MSTSIKDFMVSIGFDVDEAGMAKFEVGLMKATTIAAALGAAAVDALHPSSSNSPPSLRAFVMSARVPNISIGMMAFALEVTEQVGIFD